MTEPFPGPFTTGAPISWVPVPRYMLPTVIPDQPARSWQTIGGFDFAVGDRCFHYDRLGLRPAPQ